jgi:DNA adenine methylase
MSSSNNCASLRAPFLRWAGSKRKLLPRLLTYWTDQYVRYIEPFTGSACLFFAIAPRIAILGDLNGELIETFQQVKSHPVQVAHILRQYRRSRRVYHHVRGLDLSNLSPQEKAARFIFLNRFCFNGIYRTNLRGQFNVPYAGFKTGKLPSETLLLACSQVLQAATILRSDFEGCIRSVGPGDFVYLDPPFAVRSRRVFREYGPKPFDLSDLERLGKCLERIDRAGAHFVISYAFSSESLKTLGSWKLRKVRTMRNVAGFAANRRFAYELIATNIPTE